MTSVNGGIAAGERAAAKRSILSLQLVPRSSRLTERLLPDPFTPTPSALVSVEGSCPTFIRRSRNVGEGAHFSYTSPLVLEFPYDLQQMDGAATKGDQEEEDLETERRKVEKMSDEEKKAYSRQRAEKEMERVEGLMRPYEVEPSLIAATQAQDDCLTGYLPRARAAQTFASSRLLGVSQKCIDDCLPQLDVGDAFKWINDHSGKGHFDSFTSGPMARTPADQAGKVRVELSDFLSGRLVGAQFPAIEDESKCEPGAERGVAVAQTHRFEKREADGAAPESATDRWQRRSHLLQKRQSRTDAAYQGYAPWSNAYSGHQFGQWAGQLGDGRATTLMETQNASTGQRWEIQLKGAGRTPYSRFADGLAALFSSVREYLASEAMSGLGIPTSRALALICTPDVNVVRERHNPAAICTRLAPIWTRVGSFEHHASRQEWESVRLLGEFVCREGFGWTDVGSQESGQPWAERLIRECVVRNAQTVAQWQTYGFMHGVMNTDNISMIGLTIDYGPYGFMDIFERHTICNKSDGEGRYAYHMQPTAAMFVMQQLTESLEAIVGFEREHKRSANAGELVALEKEEIKRLGEGVHEELWSQMKDLFMNTLIEEWLRTWRKRLGLRQTKEDDRANFVDPLLDILDGYLDFTHSLRRLSTTVAGLVASVSKAEQEKDQLIEEFVKQWLDWKSVPSFVRDQRQKDAKRWVELYVGRIRTERFTEEAGAPTSIDTIAATLKSELKSANPSFILRNWVTDEVVKRLSDNNDTDFLAAILNMCVHPFEGWGEPSSGKSEEQLAEEKRLCSVGTLLTSSMPSCSS